MKTSQEWFDYCQKMRGGMTTTEQMILIDMKALEDHIRDIGQMVAKVGRAMMTSNLELHDTTKEAARWCGALADAMIAEDRSGEITSDDEEDHVMPEPPRTVKLKEGGEEVIGMPTPERIEAHEKMIRADERRRIRGGAVTKALAIWDDWWQKGGPRKEMLEKLVAAMFEEVVAK